MFHLSDSIVWPILTHGSDVWGVNMAGGGAVEKGLLWFARIVLRIKATTSNITLWECGLVPPSVLYAINAIWVMSRRCGCLVTWFCYQLIAKPGNKTAPPLWPYPYCISQGYVNFTTQALLNCCLLNKNTWMTLVLPTGMAKFGGW